MPANLKIKNITPRSGLLPLVLGVTGHIDILEEDLTFYKTKLSQFFIQLRNDCPNTPIQLLNPLAEGADRIVAHVAVEHGVELIVPLPLPETEYEKDFPDTVDEYRALKNTVAKENYFELPLVQGNTKENITEHGEHRDQQYALVGSYITTRCHILIALWDGIQNEMTGGTAQVVKYNLEGSGNPCDPDINLLDPIDYGPVFHIEARRASNASAMAPTSSQWLFPEDRKEKNYRDILGYVETFNSEALRQKTAEIEKSRDYLIPAKDEITKYDSNILDTYAMADVFAIHFQRSAHRTLSSILILAGAMALSFEIYAHLIIDQLILALYPIFFVSIVGTYLLHRKTGAHGKYLDYRALAEGLRVQIFWRLAGICDSVSANYLLKQNDELQWIREALRGCNTLPVAKQDMNKVYSLWIKDQEDYFTKCAHRQHQRLEKLERYANWLYGSGLLVSIIVILFWDYFEHAKGLHHMLIVFMGFTPIVAALWINYSEKISLHAQSNQYSRFAVIFNRARKIFETLKEDNESNQLQKKKLIKELGKEALLENGDWVLMRRERPIEIPKG